MKLIDILDNTLALKFQILEFQPLGSCLVLLNRGLGFLKFKFKCMTDTYKILQSVVIGFKLPLRNLDVILNFAF